METSEELSLDRLDDPTLLMIIDYLPLSDKIRVERVSKRWRDLALESLKRETLLDFFEEFKKPKMEISHVEQVLKKCGENLTHIGLAYLTHLKPKDLFLLINKYCKNLEYINVSTLTLKQKELNILSPDIIKNLKTVHMNHMRCDLKDTEMLTLFLKRAEKLETFGCTDNVYFEGRPLMFLSQTVKSLDLSSNMSLTNMELIKAIFARLPNLEDLDITDTYMWSYVLYEVAPRLKKFTMSMMKQFFDTDNYIDLFFKNLVYLDASNQMINEAFPKFISKKCPQLKKLNLHSTGTNDSAPEAYKPLKSLKKLEHLIVSSTDVTDKIINFWMSKRGTFRFKRLECACSGVTQKGIIKVIETLPELEFIYFGNTEKLDIKKVLEVALKAVESRGNNVSLEMMFLYKKNVNDEVEELNSKTKTNPESYVKIVHFMMREVEDEDEEEDDALLFEQRVQLIPVVKTPAKV